MAAHDSIGRTPPSTFAGSIAVSETFYRSLFLVFLELPTLLGTLTREIRHGIGRDLVFCWLGVRKDVEIDVTVPRAGYNFFTGRASDDRRNRAGVAVKGVEFARSIGSVG